jgi:hypothetical protein
MLLRVARHSDKAQHVGSLIAAGAVVFVRGEHDTISRGGSGIIKHSLDLYPTGLGDSRSRWSSPDTERIQNIVTWPALVGDFDEIAEESGKLVIFRRRREQRLSTRGQTLLQRSPRRLGTPTDVIAILTRTLLTVLGNGLQYALSRCGVLFDKTLPASMQNKELCHTPPNNLILGHARTDAAAPTGPAGCYRL